MDSVPLLVHGDGLESGRARGRLEPGNPKSSEKYPRAGGEKTLGENKRWDHTCGKDKRESVPFVVPAGIIGPGALFGRRSPGTDTSVPIRANLHIGA
jgi:hypothetical protein